METLKDSKILAITDDFWDCHKSSRHRIPAKWAEAGNQVLWLEQTPFPNHFQRGDASFGKSLRPRLREVQKNLTVGTMPPAIPRMLRGDAISRAMLGVHSLWDRNRIRSYVEELKFKPDLIVLFQQPVRRDLLKLFPDAISIYYCSDLYGYGHASADEIREEQQCCQDVDLVFTTSEKLRDRLIAFNEQTWHFPHAVDLQWWENGKNQKPKEYKDLKGPIFLFVGEIFDRIDFALVEELADRCPDWNFVFVGSDSKCKLSLDVLRSKNNVHFYGPRKWEEIPGFLNHADVLTFLYRHAPTAASSGLPFKFYEYAISGKPIFSTDYGSLELPEDGMVYVLKNPSEWQDKLEALKNGLLEDSDLQEKRRAIARENSYESRFCKMAEVIQLYRQESSN